MTPRLGRSENTAKVPAKGRVGEELGPYSAINVPELVSFKVSFRLEN